MFAVSNVSIAQEHRQAIRLKMANVITPLLSQKVDGKREITM
jgi:hypothetical protein